MAGGDFIPTSFLFGNVDSDGNIEGGDEELFDAETRKALGNVANIFESVGDSIIKNDDKNSLNSESDIDFDSDSNANQLSYRELTEKEVSGIHKLISDLTERVCEEIEEMSMVSYKPTRKNINIEKILFDEELSKMTTLRHDRDHIPKPLLNLLPEFYKNFNVTDILPFFTDDHPLRFFKLFSSIYHQEYHPKYHNFITDKPADIRFYLSQNDIPEALKIKFLNDNSHLLSNAAYRAKANLSRSIADLSNWVDGPAALWYKNQTFSLAGYSISEAEYVKTEADPVMKSQVHRSWVDKIIFDTELDQDKLNPPEFEIKQRRKMAGWVPSSTCHSYAEYCQQNNQKCFISTEIYKEIEKYSEPIIDEVNRLGSIKFNMFNLDNQQNVNNIKWDDKILWNIDRKDKTMHIPLSFCTDDSENYTRTFKNVYRGIIDKAYSYSNSNINSLNSENGKKRQTLPHKPVKPKINQPVTLIDKQTKVQIPTNILRHAVPVEKLHPLIFPTFFSVSKLQTFHRHPLRRYSHGLMSEFKLHDVKPIRTVEYKLDSKPEEIVYRDFESLSAKRDCIVAFEFSEQHPMFLNQHGMASILVNYKRKKLLSKQAAKKTWKPEEQAKYDMTVRYNLEPLENDEDADQKNKLKFGTKIVEVPNLQFPGQPPFDKIVQCFENNMYRTLAHQHELRSNDFLLIRNRDGLWVRELDGLFAVGQEIPMMEVLTPCSKPAVLFSKDFFKVYIYRLFRIASEDDYRIKMDDIKKAFPDTSENTLRKRLKHCADFRRFGCAANKGGNLVNYWILKDDFAIPDESIICKFVTPEECCAFYTSMVALQVLRDNGYVNKLVSLDDHEDTLMSDTNGTMEDELAAAPWNTSKTYLESQRGRAIYQVYGHGDPTGRGDGFSFIKRVLRPPRDDTFLLNAVQTIKNKESDRKVEASVKRLSIGEARRLLSMFKVSDIQENGKRLNKWGLIEKIIQTYKDNRDFELEAPEESFELMPENNPMSLASRQHSYNNIQNRFKIDCQRVFERQIQMLAFSERYTDEELVAKLDEDNDEKILDALGKDIEQMIQDDDAASVVTESVMSNTKDGASGMDNTSNMAHACMANKKLRIKRMLRDDEGKVYSRVELVTNPSVIEAYVKARQPPHTHFNDWEFSGSGYKEWQHKATGPRKMRKPRKRGPNAAPPRKRPKSDKMLKLKCGACGQVGHMKSNKDCPVYQITQAKMLTQKAASDGKMGSNEILDETQGDGANDDLDVLVKFEGNQVVLSKKLIKQPKPTKNPNRNTESFEFESWFQTGDEIDSNLFNEMNDSDNLSMSRVLKDSSTMSTNVTQAGANLEKFTPYQRQLEFAKQYQLGILPQGHSTNPNRATPNNRSSANKAPKKPISLLNVADACGPLALDNASEASADDLVPMLDSEYLYEDLIPSIKTNIGSSPSKLSQAENLDALERKARSEVQKYAYLYNLMSMGSPIEILNFYLNQITIMLSKEEIALPFLVPVTEQIAPNYFYFIKNPIFFTDLYKKIESFSYKTLAEFFTDIEFIYSNSKTYNGAESPYTIAAQNLVKRFKQEIKHSEEAFQLLECLNTRHEPESALKILKCHLCHIIDVILISEYGSYLNLKYESTPNLRHVIFSVLLGNYLKLSDFRADLEGIYNTMREDNEKQVRDFDLKGFVSLVFSTLDVHEVVLTEYFADAYPLLHQQKLAAEKLIESDENEAPQVIPMELDEA